MFRLQKKIFFVQGPAPPPRIARTCYGYATGSMPLVFMQEDFLVLMKFFAETPLPSFNPEFISIAHQSCFRHFSFNSSESIFFSVEIQTFLQILNSLLLHDESHFFFFLFGNYFYSCKSLSQALSQRNHYNSDWFLL